MNETLKAQWKVKKYTITFDSSGGSEVASITEDFGTEITAPKDPEKVHYTFAGWVPALPKAMPAENQTVKASWDPLRYKITFDTDGGSEVPEIEDIYGAPVIQPEDPTKAGYTFEGWMDETSALVTLPTYTPDKNPTFKAKWKKNPSAQHAHRWKYTANENTITATCQKTCPVDTQTAELTLNKATFTEGETIEPTVTVSKGWTTLNGLVSPPTETSVQYINKPGTASYRSTEPPTRPGAYSAQLTVKGQTASVDFTINKIVLLAKTVSKGKKRMVITWNKVNTAEGYDIYFGKSKVKTIRAGKKRKWKKAGLKKMKCYKVVVRAYTVKDGKKEYIKTSPVSYVFAAGGTKTFTNAKAVTAKKKKVTLTEGKKFKIKAKVRKLKKGKKLLPKKRVPTLRYMSSNDMIATVSKSGKIIAKAKGTCRIYVFAHNGVSRKIKVTVR